MQKTGGADGLGPLCLFQHLLHLHQLLFGQAGVVVARLRTIFAIFWTGARLDRQQRRNLYPVGIEMLAVNGLRFEKQVIEGLGKHRPDLG